MSDSFKTAAERHFLEGLSTARGGLGAACCPYEFHDDKLGTNFDVGVARINWMEGWQFGRFTMMQALRRERTRELQCAAQYLIQFQPEYSDACRVANQGVLRSRFKSVRANRRINELAASIESSREFKLLKELQYEFYFPWRENEAPYDFKLFDRQLAIFGYDNDERTLRGLVERYRDRHGVLEAWKEYVRSEPLQLPTLQA